jgi:hypothetical protein
MAWETRVSSEDKLYLTRPLFFALGLRSNARMASLLGSPPDRSFALFGILVRGTVAIEQVTYGGSAEIPIPTIEHPNPSSRDAA